MRIVRTNLSLQAYCELFENYEDAEAGVGIKPKYPIVMSDPIDVAEAKKSFHSIFASGDFEPFKEKIDRRMLLFCDRLLDNPNSMQSVGQPLT